MDDAGLHAAYGMMSESEAARSYDQRHGVQSAPVLTISDDETAALVARFLADRIEGRTVIEIGGGLGLLALHLGAYARRVFCIEANPMWASGFASILYASKPKNVSYLFGAADEFSGLIRGDVSIFCTHSGVESMTSAARLFAAEVVDVYGELIDAKPEAFDRTARSLRKVC